MPDTKITALAAITTVDPAADVLPIVDISDTSMAASGTTKKITSNQILGAGGTATLASATITGDLTVATDRLKVNTGSTAVQIGSTTQTQIGTTAWPTDLISKASSRVLIGNLGTTLLWNESSPAIGNASTLYIGAKTGAGATTFGGGYISAGTENASDRAGFFALSTFQSNGIDRERYRIDSTGVHTWQYVGGVAGTAMTLNATGLGVGTTDTTNGRFNVLAGTGATGNSAFFGNSDGTYNPYLQIQHSSAGIKLFVSSAYGTPSNNLIFGNGGVSETMRIDGSGNVGIGVTPAGTGGCLQLKSGITFPATQVASSDANTLDDYEEGTWTIGLTFGGGSTGITTSANTGRYTKVGRQVTVCGRLELSNKGSSTGSADITGLPFAVGSGNDSAQAASFRFNGISYTGAFQGYGLLTGTTIHLDQISEAGSVTDLTDSNFTNSSSIQISLTYTV